MADFEKFDLTKNVPIAYGNSTGGAAQAGDQPLTERDIADLRNVIAVAERGRMPDLAAQAQAMLDSGVLPARAAGKTAQAGDEPMRTAIEADAAAFELEIGMVPNRIITQRSPWGWRYRRMAIQNEFLAYRAAQVSPRATADVERENLAFVIARLEQIAGNFTDDPRNAAEEALVCARAIATTKPGA